MLKQEEQSKLDIDCGTHKATVDCLYKGNIFAVVKDIGGSKGYSITHIPSGYRVGETLDNLTTARRLAGILDDIYTGYSPLMNTHGANIRAAAQENPGKYRLGIAASKLTVGLSGYKTTSELYKELVKLLNF